jgi:predicted helicase
MCYVRSSDSRCMGLKMSASRLGNRSALEWVIDPFQVSEDKRSGIRSDPNRRDDPEYIVRLVGQVVRVGVETVRIVAGLPESYSG